MKIVATFSTQWYHSNYDSPIFRIVNWQNENVVYLNGETPLIYERWSDTDRGIGLRTFVCTNNTCYADARHILDEIGENVKYETFRNDFGYLG